MEKSSKLILLGAAAFAGYYVWKNCKPATDSSGGGSGFGVPSTGYLPNTSVITGSLNINTTQTPSPEPVPLPPAPPTCPDGFITCPDGHCVDPTTIKTANPCGSGSPISLPPNPPVVEEAIPLPPNPPVKEEVVAIPVPPAPPVLDDVKEATNTSVATFLPNSTKKLVFLQNDVKKGFVTSKKSW